MARANSFGRYQILPEEFSTHLQHGDSYDGDWVEGRQTGRGEDLFDNTLTHIVRHLPMGSKRI